MAVLNHIGGKPAFHLPLGIEFDHGGKDQSHETERLDIAQGERVVPVDVTRLENPQRVLGKARLRRQRGKACAQKNQRPHRQGTPGSVIYASA